MNPSLNPAVNSYLLSPESLGEDIESNFKNNSLYPDVDCSYFTSTENGIVFFESWLGGKIDTQFGELINDGSNYPTSIEFGTSFHYKIDASTGVTLGLGQRGWAKGTINNTSVRASMEIEYILQGNELPEYEFG